MTDKDEWNVCLKKLPHQYAVLIKTLVKASPLQDLSAKKLELLKQAHAIMHELNANTADKHKTFKISDFQKVDPPYTGKNGRAFDIVDLDRYYRPKTTTRLKKPATKDADKPKKPKKAPKTKKATKKTRKVRKDKGIKRGPQKNPKK
jgi:hypothetical protein